MVDLTNFVLTKVCKSGRIGYEDLNIAAIIAGVLLGITPLPVIQKVGISNRLKY